MSSLYAQYIKEREEKEIVENEFGFATYKIYGDAVYIEDIYVVPAMRKTGMAKTIVDQICFYAKEKGAKKVFGSADVTAQGATESIQFLLAFGSAVHSVSGNLIYFSKEIGGV